MSNLKRTKSNMTLTPNGLLGTALLAAAMLVSGGTSRAAVTYDSVTYHVGIDTHTLASVANGSPFYLDFQLSNGGTVGDNTISISNFTYTGGSATGSSTILGTASGDIGSTVSLTDSGTPSELYQQFTTATSFIGFDVTSTTHVVGTTPDQLTVAILDAGNYPSVGGGAPPGQIDTNSADTLALFTSQISDSLSHAVFSDNQPYAGTHSGTTSADYSGVIVYAVPEPSRAVLLIGGLMAGLLRRRRK